MRCPSCESQVADGSRFCPHCGHHLGASEDATREQGRAAPSGLPAGTEPELTECPRCGAPNSARRVLCGRCGADLESGAEGVAARSAPDRTPARDTGELTTTPRSSRRVWLTIVALGALIGSAIGIALWLGADAGDPAEPQPSFEPGAYIDEPGELAVVSASASSQLGEEGPVGYEPERAVDGDSTTAWNEGADGPGEGEELRLELAGPSWVRRLVIRNGYQKDGRSFFDNARASTLLVHFEDRAFEVDLHDLDGQQAVTLPEPVRTSEVVIEILEAVPGQQYDDLAITEVQVIGWPVRE